MSIALWIIAGLLAVAFLASGVMKLAQPKEKLAAFGMGWAEDFSSRGLHERDQLDQFLEAPALLHTPVELRPAAHTDRSPARTDRSRQLDGSILLDVGCRV